MVALVQAAMREQERSRVAGLSCSSQFRVVTRHHSSLHSRARVMLKWRGCTTLGTCMGTWHALEEPKRPSAVPQAAAPRVRVPVLLVPHVAALVEDPDPRRLAVPGNAVAELAVLCEAPRDAVAAPGGTLLLPPRRRRLAAGQLGDGPRRARLRWGRRVAGQRLWSGGGRAGSSSCVR